MQDLKDSLKYQTWSADLDANGITLNGLEELSTIRKRNGEILFSLVKMDAKAIEAGEAWLASETSTDGAEVTWEPQIRKRLAMAYYRRWAAAGVEKRDDKDRQRALEEATWVADRYPGEVAARFVLRGIAAAERKMKE